MTQFLWEQSVISHILSVFFLIGSGKVVKPIFRGDAQITDATSYLKSSINSYNNALGNINLRIVIKMYELLKGKYFDIHLQ